MLPSKRSQVPGFEVMSILGRIDAMRAEGRDVVSLTAGEPGSGAPVGVNQAAAQIHANNTVLNYTAAMGIMPLREAIAAHYRRWYGVSVPVERIAVTTGSSGAFMISFLAAFDPGDRVALARPGYPAYRNILTALGIEVVDLDCGPAERFQPTVAQLEAQRRSGGLAGVILASPANPTGTMIDREKLTTLSGWCAEHEVQLVSDEIYHGISFGAENVSASEIDARAVVISSFSKYWGMPGWRLGWMVLPEHLVDPVSRLAGNVALCPPHATQLAAVEAFTPESLSFAAGQVHGYAAARQVVLSQLGDLGWGEVAPADGAFYVYAHLGAQLDRFGDSTAYCQALLEAAGVAIVPGTDFDPVAGAQWVRLSLAPGEPAVAEGIRRILQFQQGRAQPERIS